MTEPKETIPKKAGAFSVRITRVTVGPPGEPLYSELCTHVSIEDESAGEFLEIAQQACSPTGRERTLHLFAEEWPALKDAIDMLIGEIKKHDKGQCST